MNLYKSYPLHLPSDGQVVWAISYNYYATPFTAIYHATSQTFVSYPDNIVFPAYSISRWKAYFTMPPVPSELPFHSTDYDIYFMNPSSTTWESTTGTAFLSCATSNLQMLADGYLVCEFNSDTPINKSAGILGLKSFSVNTPWSAVPSWNYAIRFTNTAANMVTYNNGVIVNNVTPPVVGDRIRIKRTAGIITTEYYRAAAWHILYTFPLADNRVLYPCIDAYTSTAPSGIRSPKLYLS